MCFCNRAGLYDLDRFGVGLFPSRLATHEDYKAACERCEIQIVVTEHLKQRILPLLQYDKRKREPASFGRRLTADIYGTPLRAGDRLEPSPSLRDVGAFEDVQPGTCVTFWRPSSVTRTHHRNPIFDESIGVTLDTMTIDTLHTLNLGPLHDFTMHATWELVICDAWNTGATNQEELHQLTCMRIFHDLQRWYRARRREPHGEAIIEIQAFIPEMMGTRNNRCLRLKAAETKYFFEFVGGKLHSSMGNRLARPDIWRAAHTALSSVVSLLYSNPTVLPLRGVEDRRLCRVLNLSCRHDKNG